VRLSGSDLGRFLAPLFGRTISPREATLVSLLDRDSEPIDQGLALYFPAPRSYTGEDVIEFQGHGGRAVLQLALRRCLDLGLRLAEPGEFTRRAFLNGKLDLAQAESVADLIDAGSAAAARSALRSLRGDFSDRINVLRQGLTNLRLQIEASIDFPEEELDDLQDAQVTEQLSDLRSSLEAVIHTASSGRLLRDGAQIVLVGRPNVGKSSLLNRLVGEEVAIVSEIPGTTRDALREELVIEGVPIHIVDTAGLRVTEDKVERLGIARTQAAIEHADLALVIKDASRAEQSEPDNTFSLPAHLQRLVVWNKIDLVDHRPEAGPPGSRERSVWVSARTGEGIAALKSEILRCIGFESSEEGLFLARERHLAALKQALRHFDLAGAARSGVEFFAEELRLAHDALGEITGRMTSDELLGEIFARFCIGK
jgi:tRNA modification GTPase